MAIYAHASHQTETYFSQKPILIRFFLRTFLIHAFWQNKMISFLKFLEVSLWLFFLLCHLCFLKMLNGVFKKRIYYFLPKTLLI